ncbi:MAG TPA: hypothetical protein VJ739_08325 [Gemmataceae bacterium]|nr:hypothetical protein [Gemmataceae bacterium]
MSASPLPRGNPFATRWVRPGAIPYFFPEGVSAAGLVERLRQAGWRGQVVGRHGTGKSTLLAALLPELRRAGREPLSVALHDGTRRLPAEAWAGLAAAERQGRPLVMVIDGYEQLGRWERFCLRLRCRRHGHGLLVTAHGGVGLPPLYRTEVTPQTAGRVLDHLLREWGSGITHADLAGRLAVRRGNLREALFDLYDVAERR